MKTSIVLLKNLLLIYLFCGTGFSYAYFSLNDTKDGVFYTFPPDFGFLDWVPYAQIFELKLQGNEVDISYLLPTLEKTKTSKYDSFNYLENRFWPTISQSINHLCQVNALNSCGKKTLAELRGTLDGIYKDLEDKILYPDSYKPLNRHVSKDSIDILDSDCPANCFKITSNPLPSDILNVSEEEYYKLHNKIKTSGKQCQRHILNRLVVSLKYNYDFPKKCLGGGNKTHPVCKTMLEYMRTVKNRVFDLIELSHGPDVLKTTEAKAPCLECMDINNQETKVFSNLIEDIQQLNQCLELEKGQEKGIVRSVPTLRDGTTSKYYKVKRELDGTYSIPLDLEIVADGDYDGDIPIDKAPIEYYKRAKRCLEKAGEKMLGPNGEKLKIVLQKEEKQNSKNDCDIKVPKRKVSIGSKRTLANFSTLWRPDIGCPTIIHEVLHLFGLCDHYEDLRFRCRFIERNNVMGMSHLRWNNVFKRGTNQSLLTPGQFNLLLYGSCESKNKINNQCENLAYKDSDCEEERKQCIKAQFLERYKSEKQQNKKQVSRKRDKTASAQINEAIHQLPEAKTTSPERAGAQPPARAEITPLAREGARSTKKTKKGFWSSIVSFLKGETMPSPKLFKNGKYKEYPKTREGWKNYWKDKREEQLERR